MFRRPGATRSIGTNDWFFLLSAGGEEMGVQSIFLKPLIKRASPLKLVERKDGLFNVPLSFQPSREAVDILMEWAIHETKLKGISMELMGELLWISEELSMPGLLDACDTWLEGQARSGKLFGAARQMEEKSQRAELTRDYWDSFSNTHNLKRLAAYCEACIEFSPQEYKREHRDVMRRLSDVSWTSGNSDRRISIGM